MTATYLSTLVVCTISTSYITKLLPPRQKKWNQAIQDRVALTSKMLSNMKTVKMMGFSNYIATTLQEARMSELAASAGFRRFMAIVNTLGKTSILVNVKHAILTESDPVLVPRQISAPFTLTLFVLAVYHGSQTGVLTASRAFTALAIIELITTPLALLLQTLPSITTSLACLDRIQTYLKSPDRDDQRAADLSPANRDSLEKQNIIEAGLPDWPVLSVKQATIGYGATDNSALDSISFDVHSGSVTMVVGPVGCGKSTLLKAVLGELDLQQGHIYVRPGRIAYCDQAPWIPNGTVRDCIIGAQEEGFDSQWYDDVVHACALEEDIAGFEGGSDSSVGSRGISMSDGQKHRLVSPLTVLLCERLLADTS